MITVQGINKIEEFLRGTVGHINFVSGGTAYQASTTNVVVRTDLDRVMIFGVSPNELPIGATVTKMQVIDKQGQVFMEDEVLLTRSDVSGISYCFIIDITQREA